MAFEEYAQLFPFSVRDLFPGRKAAGVGAVGRLHIMPSLEEAWSNVTTAWYLMKLRHSCTSPSFGYLQNMGYWH